MVSIQYQVLRAVMRCGVFVEFADFLVQGTSPTTPKYTRTQFCVVDRVVFPKQLRLAQTTDYNADF